MSFQVPAQIPETMVAGETLVWDDELGDYLPGDGWTLTYQVVGASSDLGDFVAVANGNAHRTTIAKTVTALWAAGNYSYQAYVEKGTDRHVVLTGWLEVVTNLAGAATHDGRSHSKKVLDAIRANIESRATKEEQSYAIAGRSLGRTPIEDLLKLEQTYLARWEQEQAALRDEKGLSSQKKIRTRFV